MPVKRSHSYWSLVWRRYRKDRLAMIGLVFVVLIFLVALLAPWISPQDPSGYDLSSVLQVPSAAHWLGTDDQGRDVASRMIHGCRISISVGFVAVGLYVLIGIIIGGIAGYFGGWLDIVFSRLIEVVICFPVFFLILTVLAFIGPSIYNIMIVIGITSWTGIARLVRGEFLKQRSQDYVQAARVLGGGPTRIMFRHILPNSMAPVLVSATFGIAGAILIESSLSFLGFGVQPPTPSWGDLLSQSRSYMDIAWWLTFFPGMAIFMTITAFNLVGEGLRDAIDPRSQNVSAASVLLKSGEEKLSPPDNPHREVD
jgi:peptide/nickel transport system permease protein